METVLWHVILSGTTVGEPIDQADRERERRHVMLSAPHTEDLHRQYGCWHTCPVRAKHLKQEVGMVA